MGSHDGTQVPVPDALVESAGDTVESVARLVLVPQQDDPAVPAPARPEPVGPASVAVVDAPSALAGFLLVMSMPRYRSRNIQGGDGRWRVSVELRDDDSLPDLIAAVERWLRRERIAVTVLGVGEDVHRLYPDEPRSRSRTPNVRDEEGRVPQGIRSSRGPLIVALVGVEQPA